MIKDKILNKSNFKLWSKLGMRASFGMIAHELGEVKKTNYFDCRCFNFSRAR